MTIDAGDLKYIAGFFDGEGTIGVYRDEGYHRVRIQIANTNKEILEWIKSTVDIGGNIVEHRQKPRSCFIFQSSCLSARKFLELVSPHLKIKKDQAELALEFVATPMGQHLTEEVISYRDHLEDRIKQMNSPKGNRHPHGNGNLYKSTRRCSCDDPWLIRW